MIKDVIMESVFFGMAITLLCYELGSYLRKKTNIVLLNPLLLAMVFIIIFLLVFDIDHETYSNGAKYIQYLLTPATVSLAVPLYRQLGFLKKYPVAVIISIFVGAVTALFGVTVLSFLFGLSHQEFVSLLPKSITTAIGMGISEKYDGIIGITVLAITVTGIVGNVFAEWICKKFKITEPMAKGLAIGTSSHALGTSKALEIGEVEGAMSSLSIVVTGIITVILMPVFAGIM